MKKIIIFLAWIMVIMSAQADIVEVEVVGTGATYEQAVNQALADAVRQVNGTDVTTQSEIKGPHIKLEEKLDIKSYDVNTEEKRSLWRKIVDWFKNLWASIFGSSTAENNQQKSKPLPNASINSQYEGKLSTGIDAQVDVSSNGVVKGYSVKKRECSENGCEVTLLVKLNKVERKAGASKLKRDRIAIITTGNLRNSNFANNLRNNLTNKIVQAQKYTVLSRNQDNARAFDQEENFLDGRRNNTKDLAEDTLPVDFILAINVANANVHSKTTRTDVSMTGESYTTTKTNTNVVVKYSYLEAATRAIIWSDSVSFSSGGSALTSASTKVTEDISNKIINKLTPISVINVTNDMIYINRGQGALTVNAQYDVYNLGDELLDPETGEKLGAVEKYTATVAINNVLEKFSTAVIVEGNINAISKGDVLRPSTKTSNQTQSTTTANTVKKAVKEPIKSAGDEQKLGSGGGVMLN